MSGVRPGVIGAMVAAAVLSLSGCAASSSGLTPAPVAEETSPPPASTPTPTPTPVAVVAPLEVPPTDMNIYESCTYVWDHTDVARFQTAYSDQPATGLDADLASGQNGLLLQCTAYGAVIQIGQAYEGMSMADTTELDQIDVGQVDATIGGVAGEYASGALGESTIATFTADIGTTRFLSVTLTAMTGTPSDDEIRTSMDSIVRVIASLPVPPYTVENGAVNYAD